MSITSQAKAALSISTIHRDIRLGYLIDDGSGIKDQDIHRWLTDRRNRCDGLTFESRQWLAEYEDAA